MRFQIALIFLLLVTSCQNDEQQKPSTSQPKDTLSTDTSSTTDSMYSYAMDHPVWVYEHENPNTGRIFLYFTPQKETYQLDLFIYDQKNTRSIFARIGFEGPLSPDSSIFHLALDDMTYNNLKSSDGMDAPFPVDQPPNINIDLKFKALLLPHRKLFPFTTVPLETRDSLIELQKNWDGENVSFQ